MAQTGLHCSRASSSVFPHLGILLRTSSPLDVDVVVDAVVTVAPVFTVVVDVVVTSTGLLVGSAVGELVGDVVIGFRVGGAVGLWIGLPVVLPFTGLLVGVGVATMGFRVVGEIGLRVGADDGAGVFMPAVLDPVELVEEGFEHPAVRLTSLTTASLHDPLES